MLECPFCSYVEAIFEFMQGAKNEEGHIIDLYYKCPKCGQIWDCGK